MDDLIIISRLVEDEIPEVNKFYQDEYGKGRTDRQFRWEFMSAPGAETIYLVARHKEQKNIIGTICAIPFIIKDNDGLKVLTGKVEDLLIHPNYRGKNLYDQLYHALEIVSLRKGYSYLWAFTYATKSFQRMGFIRAYSSNLGMFAGSLLLSISHLYNSRRKSIVNTIISVGIPVLSTYNQIIFRLRKKSQTRYTISHEPIDDLNFIAGQTAGKGFHICQDKEFLDWRIHKNPYVTFDHYNLKDDHSIKGSIICSVSSDRIGQIVQILFDSDVPMEAQRSLVASMLTSMKKRCSVIRYWGFSHQEEGRADIKLLQSSGFVFTGKGIPFVWKSIKSGSDLSPEEFKLSRMASQGTV